MLQRYKKKVTFYLFCTHNKVFFFVCVSVFFTLTNNLKLIVIFNYLLIKAKIWLFNKYKNTFKKLHFLYLKTFLVIYNNY